jgi:hypothetical protein
MNPEYPIRVDNFCRELMNLAINPQNQEIGLGDKTLSPAPLGPEGVREILADIVRFIGPWPHRHQPLPAPGRNAGIVREEKKYTFIQMKRQFLLDGLELLLGDRFSKCSLGGMPSTLY